MKLVLYLSILFSVILLADSKSNVTLATTVRAQNCISNSTHCHCSLMPAGKDSICYKPVHMKMGKCTIGGCASGYKCDCASDSICSKKTVKSYARAEITTFGRTTDDDVNEIDCIESYKEVPYQVTGETVTFHIQGQQQFQLFIDDKEVGFSRNGEYKTVSTEICPGSVIAILAKRSTNDSYGIKFRFTDLKMETRTVDENWRCHSDYQAGWLQNSFDVQAWHLPTISTKAAGSGFDGNIPWMWLRDSDMVFMRYVVPEMD